MENIKEIKESIKILFDARCNHNVVDNFAREKYYEKFGHHFQGIWYEGFTVLSTNKIQIKYGYGDMSSSFDIDLTTL